MNILSRIVVFQTNYILCKCQRRNCLKKARDDTSDSILNTMPVYGWTIQDNRHSPVVTISRYVPDAHYASLSIQQSRIDVIAILLFSKTRLGSVCCSVQFWSTGFYIFTDNSHTHKSIRTPLLKYKTIKIYMLDLKDNSCKIYKIRR